MSVREGHAPESGGSDVFAALRRLRAADKVHDRLERLLVEARERRAQAAAEAAAAGASMRRIGGTLGTSHVRALQLVRDGRLHSDPPRDVTPPGRVGVADESLSSGAPAGRICVRGGCGEPAGRGGRFCDRHLCG